MLLVEIVTNTTSVKGFIIILLRINFYTKSKLINFSQSIGWLRSIEHFIDSPLLITGPHISIQAAGVQQDKKH